MPQLSKFCTEFDVVENFTVKHEYQLTILTDHRLMACIRQVKNRKTTKPHSDRSIHIDAAIIGASMKQALGHPLDSDSLYWSSVQPYGNCDTTHRTNRNSSWQSRQQCTPYFATTCRKYSVAFLMPSSSSTFGSHPNRLLALVISGRRTFGSSAGRGTFLDHTL